MLAVKTNKNIEKFKSDVAGGFDLKEVFSIIVGLFLGIVITVAAVMVFKVLISVAPYVASTYSVFTLFFISMVVLYMFANIYMREAESIRKHYDNALTLSVLSANLCDKTSMFTYDEYLLQTENDSISYDFQSDFTATTQFLEVCKSAYVCAKKNFTHSFKSYMKLNDQFESDLSMVLETQIQNFIIYNVYGENVYEVTESSGGDILVQCYENGKGSFTAPNGAVVQASGVYANIKVVLKGIGTGAENEMNLHSYIDVYSH